MELISRFERLGKDDAAVAGGKGASLGEMTQAGIPVPPGFVVLASTFEKFLAETDLTQEVDAILESVKHDEMHTVEHASEKIQALIHEAKMPTDIAGDIEKHFKELGAQYVAVRSSATAEDSSSAAWAGQLDSYLNTTEASLLKNVQRCWASLFTPRAIFYRFEKGLHAQKISVAVVVQKMVQSEVSGIAFSVHPVTEDRNQLIIEAGYGLGEAIVSGQVTPDSYVVEKEPRNILDKNISDQTRGIYRGGQENEWRELGEKGKEQKLSDEQILELSELILKIERHYGFPCDIEWALEAGKFYITQSRPITTLKEIGKEGGTKDKELTKFYTRKRSLIFAHLWNESDREGFSLLNLNLKTSLFVNDGKSENISVYYESEEINSILEEIELKIKKDPDVVKKLIDIYGKYWKVVLPYFKRDKKITTNEEFQDVFGHIVKWGAVFNILYLVPNFKDIPSDYKNNAIELRKESDKYTESIDDIWLDYFQKKCSKNIARHLSPDEALELMNGKLSEKDLEMIKGRSNGYALFNGQVIPFIKLKQKLSEYNLYFREIESDKVTNFSGNIAYKGFSSGKVRVVINQKDISNFRKGEILVTHMTQPSFLPAMEKAVAIITDEGGITCHAAIVSRELKKPCIIGTKVGTEVLKDGDLVEVDADQGIVRILERA